MKRADFENRARQQSELIEQFQRSDQKLNHEVRNDGEQFRQFIGIVDGGYGRVRKNFLIEHRLDFVNCFGAFERQLDDGFIGAVF